MAGDLANQIKRNEREKTIKFKKMLFYCRFQITKTFKQVMLMVTNTTDKVKSIDINSVDSERI